MAVAIGVGAYELALLAAAAIAAIFVTSPAGQKAAQEAAKELDRTLSRDRTIDVAPPIEECPKKCDPCPECPPIPPRTDYVPPSAPHWPCTGTHTHYYINESNQNPRTCQCFCNKKQIEPPVCH